MSNSNQTNGVDAGGFKVGDGQDLGQAANENGQDTLSNPNAISDADSSERDRSASTNLVELDGSVADGDEPGNPGNDAPTSANAGNAGQGSSAGAH